MIGKTISHYKILEKLGEGGMGVVYKAEDLKLKRTVALKFLPPELTRDPEAKERFIQEAQAASALDHPNICNIHEIDETEDGQMFICMAYYDGETLKKKLASGQSCEAGSRSAGLSVDSVIDIAVQIAQGLVKAHKHGIIHRDIKPGNIMITKDGMVKILDFGLAKLAGQVGLTKTGTTVGTIAYMSPEQARGEEVDHRTDIWSLGVVMYEMLTGQLPFRGEYEQAVVYSILNEEPTPVSSIRKDILQNFEQIISRSLEKNPTKRYQNMEEILQEIKAPSVSTIPRKQQKSIAVLPFANMSADPEQEYFCDGMAEEIINALTHIVNLRVIARTSAFVFKGKREDVREIGRKLDVETLLEGSVRKAGNRLRISAQLINVADGSHLWSVRYDRELEDIFDIQDEISQAIVEKLKVKLLEGEKQRLRKKSTDNFEVYNLYLLGRNELWHFTEESIKKSIKYFEQILEIDNNYSLAYSGLGLAYWAMGSELGNLPPNEALPKAKENVKKALMFDKNLAQAHSTLALIYLTYDWDMAAAEAEFKKALESNQGSFDIQDNYAFYLWLKEGPEAAIAAHKEALSLNPMSEVTWGNHGFYLYCGGKYEQAVRCFEKSIELNPANPLFYILLATSHVENNNPKEALATLDEFNSLRVEPIGWMGWVAFIYIKCGKKEKSKQILEKLLERSKEFHASFSIALTYSLLGDIESAFLWLNRSIEEHSRLPQLTIKTVLWNNIKSDPRYFDIVNKVGLRV